MLVFFDTEFTDFAEDAKLISIGLISEDGQTYYAELTDTYEQEDCSEFVLEHILPKLDGGDAYITIRELPIYVHAFIQSFNEPVTLVTDSVPWDWYWIQFLFRDTWPHNLKRQPIDIGLLTDDTDQEPEENQHHALKDAQAMRDMFAQLSNH